MDRSKNMELDLSLKFDLSNTSCEFRTINERDVSQAYIEGLIKQTSYINNIPPNVNLVSQKRYIKNTLRSKKDTICGLLINNNLVATAGVQMSLSKVFVDSIDQQIDRLATIGIFIFDKSCRGKGYGKVLVWSATILLQRCLQVEWFGAEMEVSNTPSLKSFLSCGFKQVYQNKDYYKVLLHVSELRKPRIINNDTVIHNEL